MRAYQQTQTFHQPQAMPESGLDRLAKIQNIQSAGDQDTLGMLHSLYGISSDMQDRPEKMRGARLRNDAVEQELPEHIWALQTENTGRDLENDKRRFDSQWAQPNAMQESRLKEAQIGNLESGKKSGEITPADEMNFMLHTGKPYPGGEIDRKQKGEQSGREFADLQDRYTKGISSPDDDQLTMQHFGPENLQWLHSLHQDSPEVSRIRASIPLQYQNDPAFTKQITEQQAHEQHPGIFGTMSPEQLQRQSALDSINRQTHPIVQGAKDIWNNNLDPAVDQAMQFMHGTPDAAMSQAANTHQTPAGPKTKAVQDWLLSLMQ